MLQDWTQRLTVPGLPEWSGLAVLLILALLVACVLVMPFSVFGVKGRLDAIEAQLDEIRADIRGLAARGGALPTRERTMPLRDEAPPPPLPVAAATGPRSEPRIAWPRAR